MTNENRIKEVKVFKNVMKLISPVSNGYENNYNGESVSTTIKNRELGKTRLEEILKKEK